MVFMHLSTVTQATKFPDSQKSHKDLGGSQGSADRQKSSADYLHDHIGKRLLGSFCQCRIKSEDWASHRL